MDWEAEGLLEGLDDESREARRQLLDELHAEGVPVEELKQAVEEDRLVLLPVERRLAGPPRYTPREIAEEAGIDLEFLAEGRHALGLPFPAPDERAMGEDELEAARIAKRFRDAGFSDEDVVESSRVLGRGLSRYAESLRTAFVKTLLKPGDDEARLARRLVDATESMMPFAGPWLAHVFSLHLRQIIRNDVITLEERMSGEVADTTETAVAFADLVGFTELGETVPVEELGSLASRLGRIAGKAIQPPTRLVKMIGDAVMFVSPEPTAAIATGIELVERAEAEEEFPALRCGVAYGPAVNRWGDWFGGTVNLASRVTNRARPGSVLVTQDARDAAGEDAFEWSFAGEKKLKGVSEPVKTFRARRPGHDGARSSS
jgi:adenylate cyclase